VRGLFSDPSSFDDWAAKWRHRLAEDGIEAKGRRCARLILLSSRATIWWRKLSPQP
jgi:hypothetical protein